MTGEPTPFGLSESKKDGGASGQEIADQVATGWLGDYIDYATQLTDAPAIFHLAVGISMLATACGSRVQFLGAGGITYWPNLYVLFIAPSGLMRKSTSIEMGLGLLRKADPEVVLPNETSREEFLRIMSSHPEGIIRESEFASALARYSRDYMGGFKELLTDLYDPKEYYTRSIKGQQGTGEKIVIRRPALNYLAASTLEWLIDSLTENDLRSGFLSRFLIFPASEKGNWVSFLSEIEEGQADELGRLLVRLRRMPESRVYFRRVLKQFNAWDKEMKGLADFASPEMMGFYSRLSLHAAKLAAIFEVADGNAGEQYEVSEKNLERALTLMEWLRARYDELVERKLVFSKEERVMQRILEQVRKDGKIEWQVALKRAHMKTADFQRYFATLQERGEVKIVTEQTRGRPAKMIYLPENVHYTASPNGASREANVKKAEVSGK